MKKGLSDSETYATAKRCSTSSINCCSKFYNVISLIQTCTALYRTYRAKAACFLHKEVRFRLFLTLTFFWKDLKLNKLLWLKSVTQAPHATPVVYLNQRFLKNGPSDRIVNPSNTCYKQTREEKLVFLPKSLSNSLHKIPDTNNILARHHRSTTRKQFYFFIGCISSSWSRNKNTKNNTSQYFATSGYSFKPSERQFKKSKCIWLLEELFRRWHMFVIHTQYNPLLALVQLVLFTYWQRLDFSQLFCFPKQRCNVKKSNMV